MHRFLPGGVFEHLAYPGVPRGEGLAVIQRLGRDLPGMIDAHETCRMTPGRRIGRRLRNAGGGEGAGRDIGRHHGPQGLVDPADQAVREVEYSRCPGHVHILYEVPGTAPKPRLSRASGPLQCLGP